MGEWIQILQPSKVRNVNSSFGKYTCLSQEFFLLTMSSLEPVAFSFGGNGTAVGIGGTGGVAVANDGN